MAIVFSNNRGDYQLSKRGFGGFLCAEARWRWVEEQEEGRKGFSKCKGRKDIRWSGIWTGEDSFFKDWKDLYITKLMERATWRVFEYTGKREVPGAMEGNMGYVAHSASSPLNNPSSTTLPFFFASRQGKLKGTCVFYF